MITAKVYGQAALSAQLRKMELQAPGVLKRALMVGAEPIRDEARAIAPRSEGPGGHMADGIKIGSARTIAPGHVQVRIGLKDDLWYGIFPELGTSKMAAQPFMRPALDTKRNEALRIFGEEVRRHLTGRGVSR